MPRVSEPVDDTTPLTASRIDVPARIGWLLRTSRTVAGLSLRQMSAGLAEHDVHLSSTTLGRIESEGQRSPAALDGYPAVLGLPGGGLRATVDLLCGTFAYSPPAPPEPTTGTLDDFSAAYQAVADTVPTGVAWQRFARQHARADGFGLPLSLMTPLVHRLIDELGRTTGCAHQTRYDALTRLRHSPYGNLLQEVVQEVALTPQTQAMEAALGVLSERPTTELLDWVGQLLAHESISVTRGAAYALQNMLVVGGLSGSEWLHFVPHFVTAWRRDPADERRRSILEQVHAALPESLARRIRTSCEVGREAPRGTQTWARSRDNVHYEFARRLARETCARLDHRDEPLLERLLFEAMYDPRGVRMSTATSTLAGSAFADTVVHVLVEQHLNGPDPSSGSAAFRVAMVCYDRGSLPDLSPLLTSPDDARFEVALAFYGRGGALLPSQALARGLAGDETTVRRTLYALGMASDPRLQALADQPGVSDDVRVAARWWLGHGGRIAL